MARPETVGEVATAEEIAHDGGDIGAERTRGGTVEFLVTGDAGLPDGSDDLPERGGTGTARMIIGWPERCSYERMSVATRKKVMNRFG